MRILLLLITVFCATTAFAQTMLNAGELCAASRRVPPALPPANDLRSDSIDIIHTNIRLNITNFAQKTIAGSAVITCTPKLQNVHQLTFDLFNLTIDSVQLGIQTIPFVYDGNTISIALSAGFDPGDTAIYTIWYRGIPAQDASGWGGFYWQGAYAYNLGVGFAADPHNYGRIWFPCFDNFTERCTYSFTIETTADKLAFCNGRRTNEVLLPNGNRSTQWSIEEPIPSYLACVAVGPYTNFERTYPGETGPIPIQIAVAPADSNALRNSFIHLNDALAAYEYWYGPYRWEKVGYSVVPFTSGAMEHATNIAYMKTAVNGNTSSETLMAHELSHHWWGDLATCSTAGDMWLNEGWASFSEHLFLEWVYGQERYHQVVEENYLEVLQKVHLIEGGYRAVTGLPHDLTYGSHVYNKGAVVAHNLRGYLGDSLFRVGLRAVLDQTAFDDWSSADFRDRLSLATGQDLTNFFEDWVFQPGFVDFYIDSTWVTGTNPLLLHARVRQSLRGATHLFHHVPIDYAVIKDVSSEYFTLDLTDETSEITVPYQPNTTQPEIRINERFKLLQARAVQDKTFIAAGTQNFTKAKIEVKVTAVTDSAWVRVEHHFARPTVLPWYNPNQYIISNRFWEVDGNWPTGFTAEASVFYDGRGQLDQLDSELFDLTGNNEDSVVLLYRPAYWMPWQAWQEAANYTKNTLSNANDSWGKIQITNLQPGQYAIGKKTGFVSTLVAHQETPIIQAVPNPVTDILTVKAPFPIESYTLFNSAGALVEQHKSLKTNELIISVKDLPAGTYRLIVYGAQGETGYCPVIKLTATN